MERKGRDNRLPRPVWIALSLPPLFLLIWNSLYYSPYIVDDAFISLRYARNLVDGNGLVYNVGEHVEGFSNFTWVLLSAALMRLGLPYITMLKVLGLAAGLATMVMASFLAIRLVEPSERPLAGTITLWFLGLNSSLALWCQGGLETTLFAALIVGMCLRYEIEIESGRKFPWSAILFALAWMTRPEAPVYGLYFLVRRLLVKRRPGWRDLGWLSCFALLVVPYEIWGHAYFGSWIPQTHAAKMDPWGWGNRRALRRFLTAQGWGFIALLVMSLTGFIGTRRKVPPVVWAPVLSGLIFAIYAGHDWMPRFRFFVPILSFLGCFVALGLVPVIRWARRRRVLLLAVTCVLLLPAADYARVQLTGRFPFPSGQHIASAPRPWTWWRDVPANLGKRIWPLDTAAWVILARTHPDDGVVMIDIGFVGFLTMNPVWDQVGLVTPAAADLRTRFADPRIRERFVREFLDAGPPALILIRKKIDKRYLPKLLELLDTNPDLKNLYVKSGPPHGRLYVTDPFLQGVFNLQWSYGRVLRRRDLTPPTPARLLANLERRLPDVVARFPEYGPYADRQLRQIREFLHPHSGQPSASPDRKTR